MDLSCHWLRAPSLDGLFGAFELLNGGTSVVLEARGGSCVPEVKPVGEGPFLGITSSGSTGLPKLVWKAWGDLLVEARESERLMGWRWASPFEAWTFAGVQVALQAWRTGGRVTGLSGLGWEKAWLLAREQGWDAMSTTPTYMDLWVQNEPMGLGGVRLRHVTLGGEVLRPACGARLRARFPDADFKVVYASAEWGILLKTRRLDGWYETDSLDRRRPGWRVEDGVLMVPMKGGGWGSTGDLVELEGGLIRVVGRADRVANVAGSKVNLDEISGMAEKVPGVLRAVAMAEANPITGQVVVLHYEVEPGEAGGEMEVRLSAALRDRLPKVAWPRRWIQGQILPEVNGKRRLGLSA